jgi:hypothetical protein
MLSKSLHSLLIISDGHSSSSIVNNCIQAHMIHVLTLLNASLSQSYPKFKDLLYALRREEEEEHSHGWLGSFTASAFHDSETAPISSSTVGCCMQAMFCLQSQFSLSVTTAKPWDTVCCVGSCDLRRLEQQKKPQTLKEGDKKPSCESTSFSRFHSKLVTYHQSRLLLLLLLLLALLLQHSLKRLCTTRPLLGCWQATTWAIAASRNPTTGNRESTSDLYKTCTSQYPLYRSPSLSLFPFSTAIGEEKRREKRDLRGRRKI